MVDRMGEEKFSILLLGTQMAVGGAQKVLLDQARWFHNHGYAISVAFFYDKSQLHQKWQSIYPFPIHDLEAFQPGVSRIRNAYKLIGGSLRCWSLIRRNRFHAVETFTYDSNLLGLPLAWLSGVPVRIATHHGILEKMPRWRQRLHAWMINTGIASCLVIVSGQLRQQVLGEGIDARHIVTIPNGIEIPEKKAGLAAELRKELGIRSEDIFLFSAGRLTHQKAHSVLIQAMATIMAQYPETILCIAGDGPLRQQLNDKINALGLDDHVKLLGERDDIAQLMAAADIFILPSRSEGLPIAILEAMGAGRAVIATRTGGIEDVLKDGENGLLVASDTPEQLAQAVFRYLKDPEFKVKMGEAARQCVKASYTLDRMCEAYLNLMRKSDLQHNAKKMIP